MIDKSKQFFLGLFVFASGVIFVIMIYMVGSDKGLLTPSNEIFARYKHIQGLKSGAPVHLAGIQVGYVDDVTFIPTEEGMEVLLALKINNKYFFMVRRDSIARIVTQGILGDKYIQISLGSVESSELKPGDFIKTKEQTSVIDKLGEGGLFDRIDNVLISLDDLISQISEGQKIEKIMTNLEEVSEQLESAISKLSNEKSIFGQLMSKDRANIVKDVIDNLNQASNSMTSITQKIDDGTGTIGALINDPTLYEDIKILVGGAKRNALLKFVVRESLKKANQPSENR